MASGMSKVSRSSGVGSDARQERNSARRWVRPAWIPAPERGRRTVHEFLVLRAFDESDFFGREAIEFVHELVDLLIGGSDRILQHGFF
jgi:hypothetical protein